MIPGKIPWRRAWQPTPVSLPGESRGQRNMGYRPYGCKELDTTEVTAHLVRARCRACRRPPSSMSSRGLARVCRVAEGALVSSYKVTTLTTSSKPHLMKPDAPPPNTIALQVRVSTYKLRGMQTFNPPRAWIYLRTCWKQ